MTQISQRKTLPKAIQFIHSIIEKMTDVDLKDRAIILAQRFSDMICSLELEQANCKAIDAEVNPYDITWGDRIKQEMIPQKVPSYSKLGIKPEI